MSCRESDYGVEVILEDASTATLEWNRQKPEFHTIPYAKTEEGCTDFSAELQNALASKCASRSRLS